MKLILSHEKLGTLSIVVESLIEDVLYRLLDGQTRMMNRSCVINEPEQSKPPADVERPAKADSKPKAEKPKAETTKAEKPAKPTKPKPTKPAKEPAPEPEDDSAGGVAEEVSEVDFRAFILKAAAELGNTDVVAVMKEIGGDSKIVKINKKFYPEIMSVLTTRMASTGEDNPDDLIGDEEEDSEE